MLSLPMSLAAEEQETKIIERVAAINGLRTNIRLYIKREKLHRLLKETRSASLFKEFSQSNFGTPTPLPLLRRKTNGFVFLF